MTKDMPFIAELDFGMGNIRSVQKAFEHLGQHVTVTDKPEDIKKADAVILPGDGAFGKAIEELKSRKLYDAIIEFHESKKPILGICIGFQILFSTSEEYGSHDGFNFFNGKITKFDNSNMTVPHIGWAPVKWQSSARLCKNIPDNSYFYFVHSYRLPGEIENTIGASNYGDVFTAAAEKENLFAVQFHPEKSQKWGLKLLENFIDIVRN
ncbi:MAG: imidazole glycerol phosphate synthase subunit HisH [Spirochaetia bacterium]|nr:imidazole glycerol phosphate synthase subunit HisH [Spirochaetia bacterium]